MRVLVACEFSGIVRDAFLDVGHDAWSCDLLPTEVPGPHYQCDVFEAIAAKSWDIMIAFPPCTHLAVSGARWRDGRLGRLDRLPADGLVSVPRGDGRIFRDGRAV